jgi:hypothetical protein
LEGVEELFLLTKAMLMAYLARHSCDNVVRRAATHMRGAGSSLLRFSKSARITPEVMSDENELM